MYGLVKGVGALVVPVPDPLEQLGRVDHHGGQPRSSFLKVTGMLTDDATFFLFTIFVTIDDIK